MHIDNVIATILGVACGDALGAPTEFIHVPAIKSRYGPDGIQDLSQTDGRYTDDTQMTEALGLGLVKAYEGLDTQCGVVIQKEMANTDYVMKHITKQFVMWSKSPENNRAPGGSCMFGCRQLAMNKPWRKSGAPNSKGCGTAMRASPVGIVYNDLDTLREIAFAQAICTHGSRVAQEASYVAALAVHLLLRNPDLTVSQVFDICCQAVTDERFALLMSRCAKAIELTLKGEITPDEVMTHDHDVTGAVCLGESWTGDEAVASALYCFGLADARGEGYVETVRYGANTNGDSDSIACIAGSFAGARWGFGERGLPEEWATSVENSKRLATLARQLARISEELC
jgi:ADP-ribosylglycohydrolase